MSIGSSARTEVAEAATPAAKKSHPIDQVEMLLIRSSLECRSSDRFDFPSIRYSGTSAAFPVVNRSEFETRSDDNDQTHALIRCELSIPECFRPVHEGADRGNRTSRCAVRLSIRR